MEAGWHWRTSAGLNRLLCGRQGQPVCARVYARPDSMWRTAFLRLMDWAFAEVGHCERIWRRWLALQSYASQPVQGRCGPSAGY